MHTNSLLGAHGFSPFRDLGLKWSLGWFADCHSGCYSLSVNIKSLWVSPGGQKVSFVYRLEKSMSLQSLKVDRSSTDTALLLLKLHQFSPTCCADVTIPSVHRENLSVSVAWTCSLFRCCCFTFVFKQVLIHRQETGHDKKTSCLATSSYVPAVRWWGDIWSGSTWIKRGHIHKEKCRLSSNVALQKDDLARYNSLFQEV